jgi:Domain of unknown function (DUF5916)/Carbohydrate family 9 binding domain-like
VYKILLPLICATGLQVANAQTTAPKREIEAVRSTSAIKIDGELNDEAWKTAPIATNVVEQRPQFGRQPEERIKSDFYILYDDNAVYIAGFLHDSSRDSIATELVGRDEVGVNDFAGVMFDTYQDEINGVGFYVTALGEQYDCKYSLGNEDGSWNTVYETATRITDNGWTFEMMIPYSALRFSKEKVQSWGINFVRRRAKTGQQYMWNPVDPNKFGLMNQAGTWKGIQDIKAPVRLSLSPYFSTYLNGAPTANGKKDWSTAVNGGMDVKYGISKAFTLDMTLIPDFGQVQSDNQVLNLSPFEVRYNENRSFFTEGTELFNKGNLFYSRRIGGIPINYGVPGNLTGATVLENPRETKLINATKISGRTAKGLGVGFFNAITKPQHALVELGTKEQVEIETSPLTNYNILVLDQTMKNNSSVSLINTNVLRQGSTYDANVTAGLFDIYDKKINWNGWGKVATSRIMGREKPGATETGYNYELNFGKFRGPFNFEIHQFLADEAYDQQDMGYFTNNNYLNRGFGAWYKFNKPKGIYNNIFVQMSGTWSQRYKPRAFQYLSLNLNANSQLKSLWNVGVYANLLSEKQDFYEPRVEGLMFKKPDSWMSGFSVSSNSAKRYAVGMEYFNTFSDKYDANTFEYFLSNRFRFNDKLTVSLGTYNVVAKNDVGFAKTIGTQPNRYPIFGLRKQHTSENTFNVKYNFNNRMGLTFRARHYWSKVDYQRFYNLKSDGFLEDLGVADNSADNNANYFNIDMVYTWQFAQGSFINVGWKNSAESFDENVSKRYYYNLNEMLRNPQQNSLSVKVIYFLDYATWKAKRKLKA